MFYYVIGCNWKYFNRKNDIRKFCVGKLSSQKAKKPHPWQSPAEFDIITSVKVHCFSISLFKFTLTSTIHHKFLLYNVYTIFHCQWREIHIVDHRNQCILWKNKPNSVFVKSLNYQVNPKFSQPTKVKVKISFKRDNSTPKTVLKQKKIR
jgi:hypothetical protein